MKKNCVSPCALLLILLFLICPFSLFSQEPDTAEGTETSSFGLQADIFRSVRSLVTGSNGDYTQNFSLIADYEVTPGDLFKLIVTSGVRADGSISNIQEYSIQLQKNYNLNVPFLGTINVRGMKLPDVQERVVRGIRNIIPVQYVNFVLETPAQFNTFIYGGVQAPGYIVANPLMGVIEAIATAGGFKEGASYRKVHIYRATGGDGEQETEIVDISKFYQDADLEANPTLAPGDKVYIPPADIVASISGNINYPGRYELVKGETLGDLINLAGGIKPDAMTSKIEVVRIQPDGVQTIISVALEMAGQFEMKKGDTVTVRSMSEISDMITIEGAIFGRNFSKTGSISVPRSAVRTDLSYYPGISLLAVLDSVGGPTPLMSSEEPSILKRRNENGVVERRILEIEKLWKTRDQQYNVTLKPGDFILIPIQTLKVFLTGQVNNPGAFDYANGYTVNDYILLAGGIVENRGDPDGLFKIDENGSRVSVKPEDNVKPGDHIYVSKKILFQSDRFVQNLLITTGWVTAIIAVVNTVWDLVDRIQGNSTGTD
jgi:protein involved in polysaccharide export with SLBB domain